MARFSRLEVLQTMIDSGLVPVFYHQDLETAKKIASAVADGGVRTLEFTNRGDFACLLFTDLIRWCEAAIPELILGAGSVLDPGTAALFINNGANFIVGPAFNAEVAKVCNRRKVPYLPGCGSVSEVSQAEAYGVEICKLFPGKEVGGAAFVRSLLGPMPWSRIMPTGGVEVTRESVESWFKAGVACVGIGSNLITKEQVAAGDFTAIAEKTADVLGWIDQVRGRSLFAGIEHVGLHQAGGASAEDIARWYAHAFGFEIADGASSIWLSSSWDGRIEVMKGPEWTKPHIAVRVAHFELAYRVLKEKGIALEEPKIKSGVKSVFLKDPDPAGNRVHLFWRRP